MSSCEMQQAAAFVGYEWRQLSWAAAEVPKAKAAEEGRPGTGGPDPAEDAVYEVFLLHARVLRDFLKRGRAELKWNEETDIVAEDFFDRPEDCPKPMLGYLTAQATRLNRALAHLSYDRSIFDRTGKDWDFEGIFAELRPAWESFLAALPSDRGAWFWY